MAKTLSLSAPPPFEYPVTVTQPLMPALSDYTALLEGVWSRRQLSNEGPLLLDLQRRLAKRLDAPNLRLVGSGTLALQIAIAALGLSGEVITSAFTFPATPHAITWAGLTPVFADINLGLTLDPEAVERAITPATTAILGVHVYGLPCDVLALADIARRHGLRLIFDGAHAFDTRINGTSVTAFGDATALSLHATKLFHTGEGGAIVVADPAVTRRIDLLKNFGLSSAAILLPGINAKMNELEAGLGLLVLDRVEAERHGRAAILGVYCCRLAGIPGLRMLRMAEGVLDSHQYAVVMIDPDLCTVSRDVLFDALQEFNIFTRRYFQTLCSEALHYRELPSAHPSNLPNSYAAAAQVLCLPYYSELGVQGADRVASIIRHIVDA